MVMEFLTHRIGPKCLNCSKNCRIRYFGGVMVRNNVRGYCSAKCSKYEQKRARCWLCFKIFKSKGKLFEHLGKLPSHMIIPPPFCLKCLTSFKYVQRGTRIEKQSKTKREINEHLCPGFPQSVAINVVKRHQQDTDLNSNQIEALELFFKSASVGTGF